MSRRWIILLITILLVACQGGDEGPTSGTPFLGGTQGLVLSFVEDAPPTSVFDKGDFPFDVVVKVKNEGEFNVPKENIFIDILGFEPNQFSKSPGGLSQSPDEDLENRRKDSQGNIIESAPSLVEFRDLNYASEIAGAELPFRIRAEACYLYGTFATVQLCARENVVNPQRDGLCEINENKEVFNSGAPIQISNVAQSARARDKIGITFTITHVGTGNIYEKGNLCDASTRLENKVFVEVSSPLPGMTCTGLQGGDSSGMTTLFGGSKTVTCTQPLGTPRDFEFPVTITLTYDYEDSIETGIIVKHTIG